MFDDLNQIPCVFRVGGGGSHLEEKAPFNGCPAPSGNFVEVAKKLSPFGDSSRFPLGRPRGPLRRH